MRPPSGQQAQAKVRARALISRLEAGIGAASKGKGQAKGIIKTVSGQIEAEGEGKDFWLPQSTPTKLSPCATFGFKDFAQGPEIVAKLRPGAQPEATAAKPSSLAKMLRHKQPYMKTIWLAQKFSQL